MVMANVQRSFTHSRGGFQLPLCCTVLYCISAQCIFLVWRCLPLLRRGPCVLGRGGCLLANWRGASELGRGAYRPTGGAPLNLLGVPPGQLAGPLSAHKITFCTPFCTILLAQCTFVQNNVHICIPHAKIHDISMHCILGTPCL